MLTVIIVLLRFYLEAFEAILSSLAAYSSSDSSSVTEETCQAEIDTTSTGMK